MLCCFAALWVPAAGIQWQMLVHTMSKSGSSSCSSASICRCSSGSLKSTFSGRAGSFAAAASASLSCCCLGRFCVAAAAATGLPTCGSCRAVQALHGGFMVAPKTTHRPYDKVAKPRTAGRSDSNKPAAAECLMSACFVSLQYETDAEQIVMPCTCENEQDRRQTFFRPCLYIFSITSLNVAVRVIAQRGWNWVQI